MILKLTKTTAWVEVSITELLAVGMFVALPSIHTGIQAIGQLENFVVVISLTIKLQELQTLWVIVACPFMRKLSLKNQIVILNEILIF